MIGERLHVDFETRSARDLKTSGAHRYASDKTTQVTHLGWRFGKEAPQCWRPGLPFPARVAEHVAAGGLFVCHNAAFERRVWNLVLRRQVPDLPELRAEQQSCTLARALALSYPDDLDTLAKVLGSPFPKDTEGHALMVRMCKPSRVFLDGTCEFPTATPAEAERYTLYNLRDVEAESWIDEQLPELTPREREIWLVDQRINDRGIPVNVAEVEAAQALATRAQRDIDKEIRELTKGFVHRVTEATKILEWLQGRGIPAKNVTEFELSQLDLSIHPAAQRVVDLRTNGAKSSLAKLGKMLGCAGADGRLRDQYAYYKAGTGRWSGRLVQVQNLKRLKGKDKIAARVVTDAVATFGQASELAYAYIDLVSGPPVLDKLAKSMRRFIRAPKGKVFYGADFSNVEGRFNAWAAGEDWKIEAFQAYDAGKGPDLYKVGASRLTGKPVEEITDDERQSLGKVPELAGGYGGGVGAFVTMGPVYGVKPADLVAPVRVIAEPAVWTDFERAYPSARDKHGLNLECWIAIKILVRGFRLKNAKIAKSWHNLHDAAVFAVDHPEELVKVPDYHGVSYLHSNGMLWCRLPSNRLLAYAQPSVVIENQDSLVWENGIVEDTDTYTASDLDVFVSMGLAHIVQRKPRPQVRFWGKYNGAWVPKRLYGGLQCENVVQAACRDVQADAILRLEAAGYPVVMHTHDDIVSECDEGVGSEKEFGRIMGEPCAWAPGLPLAVATWSGGRYGD
jgi:DNA polymerase